MTPESQKLALLEWAGWKRQDSTYWRSPKGTLKAGFQLPNLSSIDTIAEFEWKLSELQKHQYAEYIFGAVDGYDDYYEGITFSEAAKMVFATAPQRLEALVRTLGLWKD